MSARVCHAALVAVFAIAVACRPADWGSQRVHGPDGSENYIVMTCDLRELCYRHMGERCRFGYVIVRDEPSGRHGAAMLLRCKNENER